MPPRNWFPAPESEASPRGAPGPSRREVRRLVLLAALGVATVAACGGGGVVGSTAALDDGSVPSTAPTSSEPAPPSPVTGGGGAAPPTLATAERDPTASASPSTSGLRSTTTTTSPPTTTTTATKPSSTTAPPSTTARIVGTTATTSVPFDGAVLSPLDADEQVVAIGFESRVPDVSTDDFRRHALAVLNDDRGWPRAGFRFVADGASPFRVILAEGPEVDGLCLPLRTGGTVSCQNGPIVALNADRWRVAVDHWTDVEGYRGYLVNHEVGHLLGQRHPTPRCPVPGRPAAVMEQQTGGLEGCVGNPWPRDWEIERAGQRPVVYAPLPDWGPDPRPVNAEGG